MFENVRGLFYRNKWYLEQIIGKLGELGYIVEARLLNTNNYGVPQNRERVVVFGHRGTFNFPEPLNFKVTAGDALGESAFDAPPNSKMLTPEMGTCISRNMKKLPIVLCQEICT